MKSIKKGWASWVKPPALVLVSQPIMGVFMGDIGLILALPVMEIVLVLIKMLNEQDVLNDKSVQT